MRHTSTYQPPHAPTQPMVDPRAAARPICTPHLHPAPSFASWRTHRSSVSSVSSNASGGSINDAWSTVGGGSIHGESDTSASDSDGLGATLGRMGFGGSTGLGVGVGAGLGAGRISSRRIAGKATALSIDPNLIRPKHAGGSGAAGSSTARPSKASGDGDEELPTAKPTKKAARGKASPKPKKVSHARKVRPRLDCI